MEVAGLSTQYPNGKFRDFPELKGLSDDVLYEKQPTIGSLEKRGCIFEG